MFKLSRLLVAPTLALALSLSLFSAGALAQGADQNAVGSAVHRAVTQPTNANHSHDGPSPIDMGGGDGGHGNGGGYGDNGGYGNGGYGNGGYNGYGNGGYGGYGNNGYNGYGNGGYNGYGDGGYGGNGYAGWNDPYCANHHCSRNNRRARKCVRVNGQINSHQTTEPQSYLSCKWVKAERR